MPTLIYTGTITGSIINMGTPPHIRHIRSNTPGYDFFYDFADQIVNWHPTPDEPPPEIAALPLNETFIKYGFIPSVTFTLTFSALRSKNVGNCKDVETILLLFILGGPTFESLKVITVLPHIPASAVGGTYYYRNTIPENIGYIPAGVAIYIHDCKAGLFPPYNETTEVTGLVLTVTVKYIIPCIGSDIETLPICTQACIGGTKDCFADMISHCFYNAGNPKHPIIAANKYCRNYFVDYVSRYGPNTTLDTKLTDYCTAKYSGLAALLKANSAIDNLLCGCHLQEAQYDAYAASIYKRYPGFNVTSIIKQCLYTPCVNSALKNTTIGKKCAVPQCIGIVDISIDGGVENVTIPVVNNVVCNKYTGGTSVSPEFSSWLIIVLVIAAFVLILLLIVVFYFALS